VSSDHDFLLAALQHPDPAERALTLRSWDQPTHEPRLLPLLEALLADTSPVVVSLPYHFGELRTLAANVLALERRALSIPTPVELRAARPLSIQELADLAAAANIPMAAGLAGSLAVFTTLQSRGLLPQVDR
jgi:hypothetical protein